MKLRPGHLSDASALRAIHEASWRDAYAAFVPPEAFGAPLAAVMAKRWDEWLETAVITVAVLAGTPIAFSALRPRGSGRWLLDNLHVSPSARSAGAGAALLSHAAADVLGRGGDEMWLEVLAGNAGARRFYTRFGGVEGPAEDTELLGFPADYVGVTWSRLALCSLAKNSAENSAKGA